MKYFLPIIFCFFLTSTFVSAQDDLLSELMEEDAGPNYATASFKSTRVINSHSIENVGAGVLDFRISHRFGFLNSGVKDLFGLDNATVRFGLDYGLSDRFTIGIGRSSYRKVYDGMLKWKALRQTVDNSGSPVTLSLVGGTEITTLTFPETVRNDDFNGRLSYYSQLLIARKFSEGFTFQLMPTVIHRNLVETPEEKNDIFSLGSAFRLKLSKRLAINVEYFYTQEDQKRPEVKNSLSVGFDIETGGHVFQLHLSNSTDMNFSGVIGETVGDFFKGDIHFGFNISRVFTVRKPKEFRKI